MKLNNFLLYNPVLLTGILGWAIAQILKVIIERFTLKRWNWALFFEAGGMPSSHSAMMSATALSVGFFAGFDTAVFALATIISMIVIYDATGVRRESGKQAVLINSIIEEITKGKLPPQDTLPADMGHTPGEAILGTTLGLSIAVFVWLLAG